jgi:hypothetical protein
LIVNIDELGTANPLLEGIHAYHYTLNLQLNSPPRCAKEHSDGRNHQCQVWRKER